MSGDASLTREEKKRFADWLNERGVKSCPMCTKRNWSVGDHLVAPVSYADGAPATGITTYPQVMLVCGNCAYTAFYNAVVVGLIRPEGGKSDNQPS